MSDEAFAQWRPHPWHGLDVGLAPPQRVNAYIEITPFDVVKYEVHKQTGYTVVDRPQRSSSSPPTLYGFIPRTYCAERVKALSPESHVGDRDPLDICVISERPIARAEIIVRTRVVGGLQMVDGGEADDKIIVILEDDPLWGDREDLTDLPAGLTGRLEHYFLSYKIMPGEKSSVSIPTVYGREHAEAVIDAAIEDYQQAFGASMP
jgi:inorganic pyrophosphatase